MTLLFDLELVSAVAGVPAGDARPARRTETTASRPTPVAYWIRGVFRFGNGEERTRTVDGVGISARLPHDAARFVAYLREFGWLFPEGRGVMVETLGIAANDGGLIILGDEGA